PNLAQAEIRGQWVTLMSKSDFKPDENFLIPEFKLTIKDKNYKVTFDSFGNPIYASENLHGKERVFIERELINDKEVASFATYFTDSIPELKNQYSLDARGRMVHHAQTGKASIMTHYEYQNGCTQVFVGDTFISKNCQDLKGRTTANYYLDEIN